MSKHHQGVRVRNMKPSVFAIEIEVSGELLTKLTREARERGCTVDELVELALTSEVS